MSKKLRTARLLLYAYSLGCPYCGSRLSADDRGHWGECDEPPGELTCSTCGRTVRAPTTGIEASYNRGIRPEPPDRARYRYEVRTKSP